MVVESWSHSNPAPLYLIGSYRRAIERHLRDLDAAISDNQYRLQGNQIIYAVDFTEIRSFVLPTQQALPVPVLSDKEEFEQIGLSIVTLNHIFFGAEGELTPQIILLPPHRLELRSAEQFFHEVALDQFHALAAKAESELRSIQQDIRLFRILEALQAAREGREMASAQRDLLEFLNQNASSLLLIATRDAGISAASRLRQLLERAQLVDLKEIVKRQIKVSELDLKLVTDLQRIISTLRLSRLSLDELKNLSAREKMEREARNRRDSLAVAYVLRANDLLSIAVPPGKQKRVVLLSRSNTLISAVTEFSETFTNHRLRQFVRRPTAMVAGLLQAGTDLREHIEKLRNRQSTLYVGLKGLIKKTQGDLKLANDEAALLNNVEELQKLWRREINLTVATANWQLGDHPTRSDLAAVIAALRDKREFIEIVARAAARLAAEINMGNALLARSRKTQSLESAAQIEFPTSRRGQAQPAFVWAMQSNSTIGLYFYHSAIREEQSIVVQGTDVLERLLTRHRRRPPSAVPEEEEYDDAPEYEVEPVLIERCLASSFLEAIVENWHLAETFAQLAVDWSEDDDPTPKHEAYYMLAVCRLRSDNPTEESIKAGLRDLRRADELLKKSGVRTPDARILIEVGKHYFSWWEHLEHKGRFEGASDEVLGDRTRPEPVSENYRHAIRLFNQAKQQLDDEIQRSEAPAPSSLRQLVDVTNALCYARATGVGPDDTTFRLLVELSNVIKLNGWGDTSAPTPILDTLCWTVFSVQDRFEDRDWLKRISFELASRLKNYKRTPKERSIVERHLEHIEARHNFGLVWEKWTKTPADEDAAEVT